VNAVIRWGRFVGVAKRRPATRGAIDAATHARLLAIGPYKFDVTGTRSWMIRFDVSLKAAGLPDFEVWWTAVGPEVSLPEPDDELFALWEQYRAAHRALCPEYRRRLFELLSQRPEGQYTARMWRTLLRTPPTLRDMRGAVTMAWVRLNQNQQKRSSAATYEVQVEFQVYWDEHGVEFLVQESNGWQVLGG
jgi:hypothetical protein